MAIEKARFWCGITYQENMVDDWRDRLPDILQVPFAYCAHTLDLDSKSEHRKDHVHIILAFPNTTTFKHAMSVFNLLSRPGSRCISTCEAVIGIRNAYNYLIHDTNSARKAGKYLYSSSDRICGNSFDIGSYEQLGAAEKNEIIKDICGIIIKQDFKNFRDLYIYIMSNYNDSNYFELLRTNSGFFERLTRGNYQKSLELDLHKEETF